MWNKSLHNCHGLCFLSTALLVRLSEVTLQCLRKQTQCTDKIYEMLTFNYLSKNCNCKPLKREREKKPCVCTCVRACSSVWNGQARFKLTNSYQNVLPLYRWRFAWHFSKRAATARHLQHYSCLWNPKTPLAWLSFLLLFRFPSCWCQQQKTRNDYEYSMNDCKLKEVQMTYIHTTRKS